MRILFAIVVGLATGGIGSFAGFWIMDWGMNQKFTLPFSMLIMIFGLIVACAGIGGGLFLGVYIGTKGLPDAPEAPEAPDVPEIPQTPREPWEIHPDETG